VALTVADTGIGISQDELENVFERFYRSDASRARATGGFGLGLAIVRDLVNAMGGTIRAESTEGEGSRFSLLLQVAPQGSRTADGA
jgi:two-component system OmpR family sensor kinase